MLRPHRSHSVWLIAAFALAGVVLLAGIILIAASARIQQQLVSKAPTYPATTLYDKGVEQFNKGDYSASEASLEQALREQDSATYRGQLAVVKYRLKKYDESIAQYRSLIEQGKDAAFAWNGIGNAYRDWALTNTAQAADFQAKAVDAYKQALVLNPQYVATYSNLALLYVDMNNPVAAQDILVQGIGKTSSQDLQNLKDRLGIK